MYNWSCWRPSNFTLITSHLLPVLPGDLFPSSFHNKYFTNYVTLVYTSGVGKDPTDPPPRHGAPKLKNTKICCGLFLTAFHSSDRMHPSGFLLMRSGTNFCSNYFGEVGVLLSLCEGTEGLSAPLVYTYEITHRWNLTAFRFRVENACMMKTEKTSSSEKSVPTYQSTRLHISEDLNFEDSSLPGCYALTTDKYLRKFCGSVLPSFFFFKVKQSTSIISLWEPQVSTTSITLIRGAFKL